MKIVRISAILLLTLAIVCAAGRLMAAASALDAARISVLEPAAKRGDPAAQTDLASIYLFGAKETRDETKAVHWLRQAAQKNHGPAEYLLGMALMGRKDDPANVREGSELLFRAADHGCPGAAGLLGNMYMAAAASRKDTNYEAKAVALIRRAAEGGDYMSQTLLAKLHSVGNSALPKDPVLAYAWLKFARADRPHYKLGARFDRFYAGLKASLNADELQRADALATELDGKYARKTYPLCTQSFPDEMLDELVRR